MIKIGITGQSGFVGTHLFNFLGLQNEIERISFDDSFFLDGSKLRAFVKQCDVIVHLAAMNRHNDPEVLYRTNIKLVDDLIAAMESEQVTPHVIFSSSTQEERDNLYGQSKKEGRERFINWAQKHNAAFTGLVIPNVFGPFGNPFYNSVVATFSHQLTHNEQPHIDVDGSLNLIYVGELVDKIWEIIKAKKSEQVYLVSYTAQSKVSQILKLLQNYKELYFDNAVIPALNNRFEVNLFNTFRSYIDIRNHFPVNLKKHSDARGSFIETVKTEIGGQFSFSTTHPGITRGEHFHTRKIERFTVIQGQATIEMRKIGTNDILHFELDGENPSFVDMPTWYTHNISNVGNEDLITLFWINEFFDPADPDTFFEKVRL
jgi:UDP-2-acetamido-2,6-beta-L-arabino-hexul-4-ose reductase